MATFQTLRAAISAKLATITQISHVQDNHNEVFTGYPAATFEPSYNENAFFTNTDNMRGYAFDIYIFQEIENAGRSDAIDNLIKAVDAVITAFDTDYRLGGACDFCMPVPSSWGEYVQGNGSIKYAKITILCKSEIQVI